MTDRDKAKALFAQFADMALRSRHAKDFVRRAQRVYVNKDIAAYFATRFLCNKVGKPRSWDQAAKIFILVCKLKQCYENKDIKPRLEALDQGQGKET